MSSMGIHIRSEEVDSAKHVNLVTITGDLDAHTFENLQEEIERLFDNEIYNLVIDLKKVKYVSSAGLGVIAASHANAMSYGGMLILTGLNNEVKSVFSTMGMLDILNVSETNVEAIRQFGVS